MCLAIPARLIEYLDDDRNYAKVELGGVSRRVNTTMLRGDDATDVGEYVLVHVGFALSKVSDEEAAQTLRILRDMGTPFDDEITQLKASEALSLDDQAAAARVEQEGTISLDEAADRYRDGRGSLEGLSLEEAAALAAGDLDPDAVASARGGSR